jgi:hypothetical protein
MPNENNLRVLTWHVHGSYLYYLSQTPCTFYLPHKNTAEEGYGARTPGFPWGENVVSVPAEKVKDITFDCILFQSKKNYLEDQYEILSPAQRMLPKLYLEHDPPRENPVNTKHVVADAEVLLVHVTHFNNLMWDNSGVPTTVIEHGVTDQGALYSGKLNRGIVVINGIVKRGRRLGLDVFLKVREEIPLDIVGMESELVGGLGEVKNELLPRFIAQYRFFFNPIRYTSLGLSVCEAMMAGVPVIGLATTEMPVTVRNDYSGYLSTDVNFLIEKMKLLLNDPGKADKLSQGARETALNKFNIERFKKDWIHVFQKRVSQRKTDTSQNKFSREQLEIKEL